MPLTSRYSSANLRGWRRRDAWERARSDLDKTRQRHDETRFDAGEAHRHVAVLQQRANCNGHHHAA